MICLSSKKIRFTPFSGKIRTNKQGNISKIILILIRYTYFDFFSRFGKKKLDNVSRCVYFRGKSSRRDEMNKLQRLEATGKSFSQLLSRAVRDGWASEKRIKRWARIAYAAWHGYTKVLLSNKKYIQATKPR